MSVPLCPGDLCTFKGTEFVASREAIHRQPRSFYGALHALLNGSIPVPSAHASPDGLDMAYFFEFVHHIIFGAEARLPAAARAVAAMSDDHAFAERLAPWKRADKGRELRHHQGARAQARDLEVQLKYLARRRAETKEQMEAVMRYVMPVLLIAVMALLLFCSRVRGTTSSTPTGSKAEAAHVKFV